MIAKEILSLNTRVFLLGPRQTGKSFRIDSSFEGVQTFKINLLSNNEFIKYVANPDILPSEVRGLSSAFTHVSIDEIQILMTAVAQRS